MLAALLTAMNSWIPALDPGEEPQSTTAQGLGPASARPPVRAGAAPELVFELGVIHDALRVVSGGRRVDTGHARRVDVSLGLDLTGTHGPQAGAFFAQAYALAGDGVSRLAGDLQGVSNVEAERRQQLAELWWEGWLLNRRLRVKAGKVDANSEFAFVENGAEFLQSSMGFSPTIFVLPTFPEPAFSLNLAGEAGGRWGWQLGVYDGAVQEGVKTGTHGAGMFLGDPADLFLIGELGTHWPGDARGHDGRLAAGRWEHTGSFDRFDGGSEHHTAGNYFVLDQNLWQAAPLGDRPGPRLDAFFQWAAPTAGWPR